MKLTVVTNIPAPYRDDVFCELQNKMTGEVFFLADDEAGRDWAGRNLSYAYRRAPALALKHLGQPRYIAFPTWLARRGWVMVSGFGQPAVTTALFRPSSTLLWTEATEATDGKECGPVRTRLRKWLVRRCRACVAVGADSARYCQGLGAQEIVMLPNVHKPDPKGAAALGAARGTKLMPTLVLAHVGDWSYAKGADRTAEIVEALRNRLYESGVEVRLVIAGHIIDVPRPPGSLHLGYLNSDDLWPTLMEHNPQLLLLMSRGDRWGFVVSEAMAHGVVPLVTDDVGAAADLVRPLGHKLVSGTCAEAVETIFSLHTDRVELNRLSDRARSLISSRSAEWAVSEFARDLARLQDGPLAVEGNA